MNREILFRGKRIDNGEWVEGSLIKFVDVNSGAYQCFGDCDCYKLKGQITERFFIINERGNKYPVTAEIIGQYTGLKDKNGSRIFEGDIIQFSDKIEWYRTYITTKEKIDEILSDHKNYPYERRVVKIPESYEWLLSSDIKEYWEVIGNIHDNIELIKEVK